MRPLRAPLVLAFLAVPLLGSQCTPTSEEPGATAPSTVNPPEMELQVVSIDPSRAQAGQPFEVTVFGSAFQAGASVRFQDREAERVAWTDGNTLEVQGPALEAGTYDVEVANPGGARAVLRRGLAVTGSDASATCRSVTVWFDLDSFEVRPDALQALQERASCLQGSRGSIRVEGHCDERGTTEYNLALGEKRAHAVRRALVGFGVTPARIGTVSYGEERPVTSGHDEDAWSRNRRAEILLED